MPTSVPFTSILLLNVELIALLIQIQRSINLVLAALHIVGWQSTVYYLILQSLLLKLVNHLNFGIN